ncbi:MAG: TIGR00299 family protein [Verrucomicrobia bacterium A1]|nr:MAG: TIGR00299 family protein [Verrucomicrobia bacterium A1]
MKILHFECVGGASGDMILGALIELGVDPSALQRGLARLPIEPFEIEARPFRDHHLAGTQVTVRIPEHRHEHGHGRGLKEITGLIQASDLPPRAKELSLKVFGRIADAEAKVHGTTREEVHFHEVGALDSIIDIVGGCLGLERLGVEAVAVGPFPAGRGIIECAHGVFPNPAPATVELLKGFPVVQTEEPHELVTPTGAALLTTWKTLDAPPDGARPIRIGYSFGHRKLERRPNLLRATLLESEPAAADSDSCVVLECNLDDTTPELLGSLTQRLLEAGAMDAFTTAVQMKKQRPGTLLTVLCAPGKKDALLDLIFRESTTFGVREYTARRTILERRIVEVQTPHGPVHIKIGRWKDADVTRSPEMDDCIRLARERGVPVRTVYETALQAAQTLKTPP